MGVIQAPAPPLKAALSEHTAYIYSTLYHTYTSAGTPPEGSAKLSCIRASTDWIFTTEFFATAFLLLTAFFFCEVVRTSAAAFLLLTALCTGAGDPPDGSSKVDTRAHAHHESLTSSQDLEKLLVSAGAARAAKAEREAREQVPQRDAYTERTASGVSAGAARANPERERERGQVAPRPREASTERTASGVSVSAAAARATPERERERAARTQRTLSAADSAAVLRALQASGEFFFSFVFLSLRECVLTLQHSQALIEPL